MNGCEEPTSRRQMTYYHTWQRINEILRWAPWSSFDLLSSGIVFGSGLHLLLAPGLFGQFGGVYSTLARLGTQGLWGTLFLLVGGFGIGIACWPTKPPFLLRLLARMSIAFCFLTLAFNNLSNPTTLPLSTTTYGLMALSGLWGIWRTRTSGR